ncbi:SDR family NAD(P)-dependent oxidoreductase [Aliiglaciecola sp. CAU 1673]|uniref:SDR family NAD(P)-dependent oxidoreductase n=1 Tax=Aliiglaciecola sp. CAU 1673 TaxID=3032595 RepID=UPI0023D9E656|nr:SDR family NAD(P)-dependent oxidoreductase [Aliiglaciecola sp. CAU 1673]MDF2178207.1 SDR family NAD(P)-dependent oxidoreductase [Aliiglaciecola sp. CAU 1673]
MKRMLITGATSGIGLALTKLACERGYKVIACGRNKDKLETLKAELDIEVLSFDVTDKATCRQALSTVQADIFVLNAGTCEYLDVDAWDSALFTRVFDTNFFGVVYCLDALVPKLKSGNQLVLVDSLARLLPFTKAQAYGASKAAVHYLARSLEVDLEGRGIKVQTVSPGFVKTPLTDKNSFEMPMRIDADQAANSLLNGIEKGKRQICFPFVFSTFIRLLALLPEAWQISLCKRMKV